jgi:hypothetical protein
MLITIWPYGFALATMSTVLVLVWLRPAWWQRAMLGLPFVWAGILVALWAVLLFSDADNSRMAMLIAALIAPPLVLCIARMLWLCREEKSLWAASWGYSFICVLAMFSQRWLIPSTDWGASLSIVALTLMMLASWTWGARARYDLFDRSQPPQRIQLSIRQIALGISLVAIVLAESADAVEFVASIVVRSLRDLNAFRLRSVRATIKTILAPFAPGFAGRRAGDEGE